MKIDRLEFLYYAYGYWVLPARATPYLEGSGKGYYYLLGT